MRSLKKLLAVLLALTMMLSIMVVPAFAAESLKYEDEAKVLYDLDLFRGKSTTEFVPDLESRLERQDGVALVLRLFNLDTEAEKMSESEAKALLAEKFADADKVAAWAVKYVAYAVKNGIVDGRPDGNFAPNDPLLGKEFAKMILAELGQYDPANFQTACADLAAISDLSAAEAIRFNDKILIRDDVVGISFSSLAAQYADGNTVLGKLSAANAELKAKAIELGLIAIAKVNTVIEPIAIKVGEAVELPAKVEVEYADGSVAEVAVAWDTSAVKADVAGEYKAVGTVDAFDGTIEVAITVTPDVLAVDSVSADNLKEIVVVFNQDVSENAEVAKKDNYTLDTDKIDSVKVDGNTAILTLVGKADNQEKAKLTVSNKILEEKEEIEFTFFDAELPEVLGIEITGPKSVLVKFSEPLETRGKITLKKGSSTLSVSTNYDVVGKSEINVPMYSSFVDGETYEITIKEFEDFAGYANIVRTIEFVYEKDETAPVATIEEATQKYVKVSFNKPVKGLVPEHFSHTFSAWTAFSLTKSDKFVKYDVKSGDDDFDKVIKPADSVSEVYVWFYNNGEAKDAERAIPEGETSFRIRTKAEHSDKKEYEIKDEWSNKLEEVNVTISVSADITAPEITSIEVKEEDALKVKFSKNVKFNKDNVEVLDTDGKKIDGVKVSVTESTGGKEYTIQLGKKLAGKTILVNITKVEDTSLNANKMADYSTTLEITDKTAPKINKVTIDDKYVKDETYIYVFYDESVDSETALKASNYFIYDGSTYTKLSGSTSFFSGDKIVKIAVKDQGQYDDIKAVSGAAGKAGDTVIKGIFVSGVKDLAGNEIIPGLAWIAGTQTSENRPEIDSTTVKATAPDKIELKFNQELASVVSEAFEVVTTEIDVEYDVVGMDVTLDKGNTKVILTVEGTTKDNKSIGLPYNPEGIIKLNLNGSKVENLFGVDGVDGENIAVADKIAPEMASVKAGSEDKTIEVTFKEALDDEDVTLYAHDFVVVEVDDNDDELKAGVEYKTKLSDDKKTIIITIESGIYGEYTVETTDTIKYIKDAQGNYAKKFDTKTVELKAPKEFTYNGETEIEITVGDEFTTPVVKDGADNEVTPEGEVNVDAAGEYKLTYKAEGYKDLVITVTVKEAV